MTKENLTKIKISTVVPTYNQEKHLEEALTSIINQTFKPYEILIINDASTDDSKNIYENVSEKMKLYEGFKIYMAIISVASKYCPLKYKEKIEYIKEFATFENADCLFKYMKSQKELLTEYEYLENGEIEKFYNIICNK